MSVCAVIQELYGGEVFLRLRSLFVQTEADHGRSCHRMFLDRKVPGELNTTSRVWPFYSELSSESQHIKSNDCSCS